MDKLFVFDTNILLSASLVGATTISKAMDKAIIEGKLAFSDSTIDEFTEVLFRKKFDTYFLTQDEKWRVVFRLSSNAIFFSPTEEVTASRDSKDNKFLEIAVAGEAYSIINGDDDLLVLHPCLPDRQAFRGIPIVNASDFLNMTF